MGGVERLPKTMAIKIHSMSVQTDPWNERPLVKEQERRLCDDGSGMSHTFFFWLLGYVGSPRTKPLARHLD